METVDRPPDEGHRLEPLPDIRPEPPTYQDIQPQLDFLYRASETFERSVQFADAKAGGVVLILGIGILDLFRHVWGNAKGSFRTKGRYASATVRGTLWRTDDYCNGTLITVLRGRVDVFDLVLHKHFLISAGHSYFAPS